MDFQNITFLDLHILHWLLSVMLPLILIVMSISYLIISLRISRKAKRLIEPLIEQIDGLSGRTIKNLPAVADFFELSSSPALSRAFEKMTQDCKDLYQSRWLPDPGRWLRADTVFGKSQVNSLSLRPAARLLAVGILAALTSLLVQNQIPAPTQSLGLGLILLPLLIGLSGALLTAAASQRARQHLELWLQDLKYSLESRLPVFNDQAGLSLLVDKFTDYDQQMQAAVHEFNATASRLADSEMADGIRHSVEQVLLNSVAPSIQQATTALSSLAGELTNRQERGMQDLAIRFATALSADLAGHLQPINKEIELMGALMSDVKNYIEYAMRSLDTTRKQSESQLADTREAMQMMAESRHLLTEDFAHVDDQVQILTAATSQMADLWQGNEKNMALNIEQFGQKLDQYGQNLGAIVSEAVSAMKDAKEISADQQNSAGIYLGAMQDQVNILSRQLGADIQELLGQVRQESTAIAEHSGTIAQQLGSLNKALDHSLNDFTQASAQYVSQTLTSFDTGLAELAERLARTTAEIRDAVDALPMALRQGQSAHFDG